MKRKYTLAEARDIAARLEVDFATSPFDLAQFHKGINVEAEHGQVDPATNVTGDDPILTGKIALTHLHEFADYYTRLHKMEAEARAAASRKAG
jgi:hypothetical protein